MGDWVFGPRENLKRIPLDEDSNYLDLRDAITDWYMELYAQEKKVRRAVNGILYHGFDDSMDDNGMEKATAIIAGMLFQMQYSTLRDPVDRELAQVAWEVIKDLDTGEYYDLMSEEDAEFMKMDVRKVRSYLKEHPGLLR